MGRSLDCGSERPGADTGGRFGQGAGGPKRNYATDYTDPLMQLLIFISSWLR